MLLSYLLFKLLQGRKTELNLPNYDVFIIKAQFFFTMANITKKLLEETQKYLAYKFRFIYLYVQYKAQNREFFLNKFVKKKKPIILHTKMCCIISTIFLLLTTMLDLTLFPFSYCLLFCFSSPMYHLLIILSGCNCLSKHYWFL